MQEGRYNEIPYNFLEDVVQPSNITIKDMMDVGNFMPKTKKAEDSFCDEEAMLEIVSQDAAGIEPPVKAYRLTRTEAMHLAGMSQEAIDFSHTYGTESAPPPQQETM